MTERDSENDADYPDGSVGRYVREQWGASTTPRKTRPYVAPVQPPQSPVQALLGRQRPKSAKRTAQRSRTFSGLIVSSAGYGDHNETRFRASR